MADSITCTVFIEKDTICIYIWHVIAWVTFERNKIIACHIQEKLQSEFCMEKEEIIKIRGQINETIKIYFSC